MQFFSWRRPFQRKLLFFQTIESGKRAFATRAGSGKPAFLHGLRYFSKMKNKTAEKITEQCFPYIEKVKSTKMVAMHLGYVTGPQQCHFNTKPGLEIKFFPQEQCFSLVQNFRSKWFEEGAKK